MDAEMQTEQNHEIVMTNAATTIDPNVVQSRILQSSSLAQAAAEQDSDDDDDMEDGDDVDQPTFPKLNAMEERGGKSEYRRVRCPKHRYTPLRQDWEQILMPLVQFLKLQVSDCIALHYVALNTCQVMAGPTWCAIYNVFAMSCHTNS